MPDWNQDYFKLLYNNRRIVDSWIVDKPSSTCNCPQCTHQRNKHKIAEYDKLVEKTNSQANELVRLVDNLRRTEWELAIKEGMLRQTEQRSFDLAKKTDTLRNLISEMLPVLKSWRGYTSFNNVNADTAFILKKFVEMIETALKSV